MQQELTDQRIRSIGGEGWLTAADLERFSRQARVILRALSAGNWWTKRRLEVISGSERISARIYELREVFEIESRRTVGGVAEYRLVGKRETELVREKKHCETCTCL